MRHKWCIKEIRRLKETPHFNNNRKGVYKSSAAGPADTAGDQRSSVHGRSIRRTTVDRSPTGLHTEHGKSGCRPVNRPTTGESAHGRRPSPTALGANRKPTDDEKSSVTSRSDLCRAVRCSVELWEIILHGYREPQDLIRLTSTEFYNRQLNASARDKIRSGINRKLLDQVNDISSAKELWDRIVVLTEGTDLIQSSLYETAKQEAHRFMIREGESLADAYARLGALKVRIKGLGAEKYDDGFEMNEGFIKSKVIAMIAVKQEDTNTKWGHEATPH
ncbi:hypothetical protein QYE76_048652 [Lolium multiflorum]|uniref:Uncharacterized protein n=1 Tax=Lolium multiflorum TaxID=4521 RepID=A0AAD8SLF1_LOLMU|nr:hypothetical protein QYE76_048652 [Lolium multiflorum]